MEIFTRYTGGALDDDMRAMVPAQAPKRVALEFVEHARDLGPPQARRLY